MLIRCGDAFHLGTLTPRFHREIRNIYVPLRQNTYLWTCAPCKVQISLRFLVRLHCAVWFEATLSDHVRRYVFPRWGLYVFVHVSWFLVKGVLIHLADCPPFCTREATFVNFCCFFVFFFCFVLFFFLQKCHFWKKRPSLIEKEANSFQKQ